MLGLTDLVDRFLGLDVLVVGDLVLDSWISGPSHRLCREAPVPVISVDHRLDCPGGAGNTAVNLAALGARPRLLSAVGDDIEGADLRAALGELGVPGDDIGTVAGRRTVTKRRLSVADQILARYDDGDTGPLPVHEQDALIARLRAVAGEVAAVVVCDYDCGVLGERVVRALSALRGELGLLVVDAHNLGRWRSLRPDVVTPSFAEVQPLLPRRQPGEDRAAHVDRFRSLLARRTGAGTVVVTLDTDGAVLLEGSRPGHRTYARPAPTSHTSGAGDSFVAGLVLALAAGAPAALAVEVAQAAADVAVRTTGTSPCGRADLLARLAGPDGGPVQAAHLIAQVGRYREQGRRLVFTNGCFDVLHRGHVAYLNRAKELGDVLIVAVNSDASVGRLKGPDRPVNPVDDRAAVLAALSCVDHVVVFEADSPVALLEAIRPDIYVKGGDYTAEMVPEAPIVQRLGGRVQILGYVEDRSTTAIIDRIRAGSGERR